MHWYNGSIADAVLSSKQRNVIFVVFVEGTNDLSTKLSSTIEEESIRSRLANQSNFLAIKLQSGSIDYTHFAQIYQLVPVPSLFFIGRNGAPLEVVCADMQPSSLAERIDRILDQHRNEHPAQPSPSQNVKQKTTSLLVSESEITASTSTASRNVELELDTAGGSSQKHKEVFSSPKDYCKDGVCVRVVKKAEDPGPSKMPVQTQDTVQRDNTANVDKVRKAHELIEARRMEKAEQEKELERQKELERRAMGQGVSELKRKQEDDERRMMQEERKREKLENNLARQRILEQIAFDRAERRAKDAPPPTPAATEPPVARKTGDIRSQARVQFKLPDGNADTAVFAATATVSDVTSYVSEQLHLSPRNYSLWIAFPRQELTNSNVTLRDLQLAPSGALLVLPRRQGEQSVSRPSQMSNFIELISRLFTTIIWTPTQQLYSWLRERLAPPPAVTSQASGPPSSQAPGPQSAQARNKSNIRSLHGDSTKDDDNNTWNGNSTQQM